MKQLYVYASRGLFYIGILLALFAAIFLVLNLLFGQLSLSPIYWLAFPKTGGEQIPGIFGSILLIWFSYPVLAIIGYVLGMSKSVIQIGAKGVILAFIALILIFFGSAIWSFQSGPFSSWQNVETEALNNRVYHLQLRSFDGTESWSWSYRLYECDRFDLFCAEMHRLSQNTGGISPEVKTIRLVPDTLSKTMSVEVNGLIIFSRHVD